MRIAASLLPTLVGLACAGTVAQAQINSPPPPLMGEPSHHLYSVPGVISIAGLATFFGCTNTTSAAIRVGVEMFSFAGLSANDPSATSLSLSPGGTALFGTGAAVGFSVDSSVGGPGSSKGSARILATAGSGIICSAFLANDSNAPPTSIGSLSVVKKTKQKGD